MEPETNRPPARTGAARLLWGAFLALLALVFAADFLVKHHAYFGIDGMPGFKALFGFAAVAALIVAARLLGALLQRPDDYYDE